jgi:hypothetical protein
MHATQRDPKRIPPVAEKKITNFKRFLFFIWPSWLPPQPPLPPAALKSGYSTHTRKHGNVLTNSPINFLRLCLIQALSAHSAAEFNISPGRWQHLWLVAIVPPKRWGKMDRNDCLFFFIICFFQKIIVVIFIFLT